MVAFHTQTVDIVHDVALSDAALVLSVTSALRQPRGLPAYFACHSALEPAGGKMAECASSSSSVRLRRREGWLMDENGTLSLRRHDAEPLNIYPSYIPPAFPSASVSLFVYLILCELVLR